MALTTRAVNTGCAIGLHKSASTYMRHWGATQDAPLTNHAGKVDKAALIAQLGAQHAGGDGRAAP